MEKNEGLFPDGEHTADFTGFSEDQSNKAIEGGVGKNKTIAAKSLTGGGIIAKVKAAGTIFSKRKKAQL